MSELWGVVPAAGTGRRFGGSIPKQYCPLVGRTVIEWAIAPLLGHPRVKRVVVALAPGDERWRALALSQDPRVNTVEGGDERSVSVTRALDYLRKIAAPDDWVLVHDAVRPCLSAADLDRLVVEAASDGVGGILASPVTDTLKRADAQGRARATLERSGLWRALTPQMFRLEALREALRSAETGGDVTDEAMAMELAGHRPLLVSGDPGNIKITDKRDLALAERFLER